MTDAGSGPGRGVTWRLDAASRDWPPLWRELPDPPAAVHGRGCRAVLGRPILAIVGTRRPTPRGAAVAHELAAELAYAGWVIASGLAHGIDAAAHRGALSVGGLTVAVLAGGLDDTYPSGHRALRAAIERHGCVLSEYPPGTPPRAFRFLARNRLVAGMARGVLVVEAPANSGALTTARFALDYDRDVLAVPGPVDAPQSAGCHELIRAGAALVAAAAHVHEALPPPLPLAAAAGRPPPPLPAPGSPARWLLDRLDLGGTPQSELHSRWAGTPAQWAEALLALEMAGLIRRLPGGRLARTILTVGAPPPARAGP